MDQQDYYLQHTQQQQQTANGGQPAYQQGGMGGYPANGQQMPPHIPSYHQAPHYPNIPNTNPHIIDYSIPPPPPPNGAYHPTAPQNYAYQLHPGYHQPQDPYLQQAYQPSYDYDPAAQIGGIPYYGGAPNVSLAQDSTQAGSNGQQILSGQTGYGQYPSQLPPPPGHYQQNLGIDPNNQQAAYGQYHPHPSTHHQNFGQNPQAALDQANYLAFGQQSQYHGSTAPGYLPFNQAVQQIPNGQIHPHNNPYGLIPNHNQIGIIDPTLQQRPPQPTLGKTSIKNEEQTMDNELHLANSLGDSQSQAEDKLKQGGSNYLIPSQYDQQQYPAYYALGPQQQAQNQYFQGYSQYPPPQLSSGNLQQPGSQNNIPSLQNPSSQTSIKDKDDPSKRQPNSPGRKKAIKKGSPTGNTEPSSPASPRGRKRKNTIKADQPQQPESSQTLNSGLINSQQAIQQQSQQQQQQQQQQFGLHLMKVPNQDQQKQMGYPVQPYYQQVSSMGKLLIDPATQHISGIDQNSLQRLKELPTDFNMNEFAAVYEDQKLIGSISKEERKLKIKNYQDKRKRRSWQKKISYDVRKKVADGRLRVKGRFVTKKQAMEMLSIVGKEEDYTMDQLKDMLKSKGIQANGGEEDSKSPTLPNMKKKNQSQPGTIVSLKGGEDDEDEGYLSGEVRSEELNPPDIIPIIRGKSCESIQLQQKTDFFSPDQQPQSYYPNQINNINNILNTNNNNNENPSNIDNQLHLKMEQREIENQQIQINKQQQIQFNQLQQQSSYSSNSQSPLRSPKKFNNNQNAPQSSNTVKYIENNNNNNNNTNNNQLHNIQMNKNDSQMNNINGHTQYADPQNGESPQHSANNILSQEMTDQFGNLNIKSPDQKQKIIQSKNNPQLINLNDGGQQFFGNQGNQNQYIYNQQYNNGTNGNYPIHQQQ